MGSDPLSLFFDDLGKNRMLAGREEEWKVGKDLYEARKEFFRPLVDYIINYNENYCQALLDEERKRLIETERKSIGREVHLKEQRDARRNRKCLDIILDELGTDNPSEEKIFSTLKEGYKVEEVTSSPH